MTQNQNSFSYTATYNAAHSSKPSLFKYCAFLFTWFSIFFLATFIAASIYPAEDFYLSGIIFKPVHLLLITLAFVSAAVGFFSAYTATKKLAELQSRQDSKTNS